jgi:hypothetical protein
LAWFSRSETPEPWQGEWILFFSGFPGLFSLLALISPPRGCGLERLGFGFGFGWVGLWKFFFFATFFFLVGMAGEEKFFKSGGGLAEKGRAFFLFFCILWIMNVMNNE